MPESKSELRTLIDRLGFDISFGHHHVCIGATLEKYLSNNASLWEKGFEFLSFTLKAHFEAGLLGLARLLDERRDALRLGLLPAAMEAEAGQFSEFDASDVRTNLIPSVRRELEELAHTMEPLRIRRDQLLAHSALEQSLPDTAWNIAFSDLEAAYERVRELVNRVATARDGKDAKQITGALQSTVSSDVDNLFGAIQQS